MIRFQFVYDYRTEYSVKRMCDVLKLNRSSFYKWVNTREDRRLKICSDALIGAKIKTIFDDEHGLYVPAAGVLPGRLRQAFGLDGRFCRSAFPRTPGFVARH